jgi:hypothetical protein
MPGPLPNPQRRRTNQPTIPTTQLPLEGRKGKAPRSPYPLGAAGAKWWRWAWKLPQATVWDAGALYGLARRAQLEDELAALSDIETPDLTEVLGAADDRDAADRLEWLLRKLTSRSTGSTTLMREMRELDNRFGLNAKAMADLRWSIAPPEEAAEPATAAPAPARRLRAV